MLTDVNIDERKAAGHAAALATHATEHKDVGATSETNFPYTYWFVVGYNEAVDEQSAAAAPKPKRTHSHQ